MATHFSVEPTPKSACKERIRESEEIPSTIPQNMVALKFKSLEPNVLSDSRMTKKYQ